MTEKRILLLDDDNEVRFNLKLFFEDEGFICDAFENAESALSSLNDADYEIAIVDIRLPGMDGERFITEAYSISPGLKYIIHTGSAQYRLPDMKIDSAIPVSAIIHKPVTDMNIFIERIEQMKKLNGI